LTNLRGRAESTKSSGRFSWAAISNILQNVTGQSIDYREFVSEYERDPTLQELVADYNDQGLTLVKQGEVAEPQDTESPMDSIQGSAKKAASRVISR